MEVFIWFCQTHLALDLAKLTFKIWRISCFLSQAWVQELHPQTNAEINLCQPWLWGGSVRVVSWKEFCRKSWQPPVTLFLLVGATLFSRTLLPITSIKTHFCDTFLGHKLLGHFCSSPLFWGHISVSDFQETPLSHTSGTSWAAAQQCFHSHISRSLLPVMGCSTTCFPPVLSLFPLNSQVMLDWGLAPISCWKVPLLPLKDKNVRRYLESFFSECWEAICPYTRFISYSNSVSGAEWKMVQWCPVQTVSNTATVQSSRTVQRNSQCGM